MDSESDEEEHEPLRRIDPDGHDDTESEIGSTIEVDTGSRDDDENVEQQSHDPKEQIPYPTPESSIRGTQPPEDQGSEPEREEPAREEPALRRSARIRHPTEK